MPIPRTTLPQHAGQAEVAPCVSASTWASAPTNWPISRTTSARGRLIASAKPANDRAADDQAVGHRGELADLVGTADPEADADRQIGLGPQPGDVVDELGGEALAFAGDPRDRDVIDESRGRSGRSRSHDRGASWA